MHRVFQIFLVLVVSTLLIGCGGGGGSSSGSNNNSGGGNSGGGGSVVTDTLSLSASSLNFSATEFEAAPDSTVVTASISGSNTAGIVVGTLPGVDSLPSWLDIQLSNLVNGSATAEFFITTTDLREGTYNFTIRVLTVDSSQNVLDQADITIQYSVAAGVRLSVMPQSVDLTMHDASEPVTEIISVTSGNYVWAVSGSEANADPSTSTGSQDVTLEIFPPMRELVDENGEYQGSIDIFQNGTSNNTQFFVNYTIVETLENLGNEVFLNAIAGEADGGSVGVNLKGEELNWAASADVSWLSLSENSGVIETDDLTVESPDGDDFTVMVDGTNLTAGRHTGVITVTADAEQTLEIPVTVEVAAPIITASKRGFAFSDTPIGSVLTATVDVGTNVDRVVGWTASSNAAWLSVTPSGSINNSVVITADPAALVNETTTEAVVTLVSSETDIENTIEIKVGLWKSAVNPVDGPAAVGGMFPEDLIVADPIRPLAYLHSSEMEINIVHTYTGVVEKTFPLTERVFNFDVSDDGAFLYLVRSGEDQGFVDVVDLDTQDVVTTFSYPFDRLLTRDSQDIGFGRIGNDAYLFITAPSAANTPGVAVNAATGQVQTIVGEFPESRDVQNNIFCSDLAQDFQGEAAQCFEIITAGFEGARISTVNTSMGFVERGGSTFLSQDGSRLFVVSEESPIVYNTSDFSAAFGDEFIPEDFLEFAALGPNDNLYVVLKNDGFIPTDPSEDMIDERRKLNVYDRDLNLLEEITLPSEGGVNPIVQTFGISGDRQRLIILGEDFNTGSSEVRFFTLN